MKNYVSSHFLLGVMAMGSFCLAIIFLEVGAKSMGWIAIDTAYDGPHFLGFVFAAPFLLFSSWCFRQEWKSWK